MQAPISMTWRSVARRATGSLVLLGLLSCTAEVRDFLGQDPNPPGVLVAAPVQFDLTALVGQPIAAPAVVQITAGDTAKVSGLSIGSIQFNGPSGWLNASISSAVAPATLQISFANSQLPPGYYSAVVPIVSTSSGNSPQNVIVTLTVDSLPVIALSSDSVHFAATAGGANPSGVTVQVTNGGGSNLTQLTLGTIAYTPAAPGGWLTATLGSGTGPTTLQLQAATGALPAGSYSARVPIQAAGGVRDTVRVFFTVAAAPAPPRISMVQSSLNFAATVGGNDPAAQVVTVTNTGGGTLTALSRTITYTSGTPGWLTATLGSTTGPTTLTFQPATGNLGPGTYRATVIVSDPTAANTDSVRVVFTLTSPPRIGLSRSTVTFSAASGGANPAVQAVSITNSGGGSLTGLQVGSIAYGPGQPTGWLTASLNGSNAPATLTLGVTVGSLQAGQYTASIPITSTLGIPGQVVDVTFTLSGGTGAIVGLLGLNQTGFSDSVLPQQVVVRLLNAASNPVVGATVTWTAGQGGAVLNATTTTNSAGEVRASWRLGSSAGAQTLTASSPGVTPYVVNAVAVPAGGGNNPGEPPGFVVISNRRFDAKVEDSWLDRGDANFSIQADANAPQSAPNVGQALFPQGFVGGRGPINTYRVIGQYNRKQIYLSFWFKLSPNWFGGATNGINKVLHIWINGGSVVVFSAQGSGNAAITPQMRLQNIEADQRGISFNLNPNLVPTARLIRGQWHRIEVLLISNTPGVQDGHVEWWLDGQKIANYTNVGFISASNTTPGAVNWQQVSWNPTYGAPADNAPDDMYMQIDHFYISGK